MEVALPGDRGLYRNRVTLTKEGRRLDLLQRGLGAAGRALSNACYGGLAGGLVSMLASTMLFDQMFVIEGALRYC